jgi:hypothetical protein
LDAQIAAPLAPGVVRADFEEWDEAIAIPYGQLHFDRQTLRRWQLAIQQHRMPPTFQISTPKPIAAAGR